MNSIMATKLQFMRMATYKNCYAHLYCFVCESLFISPRNYLMTMNHTDFEPADFDNFLIDEIFKSFIFEITLDCIEITW